mmetsp:Transcript_36170/g.87999  ORF Transcript_36170/g.87999 Transcript_36170/m.87999 type:complete len:98 (+) Transcript_36170:181-474(+)
MVVRVAASTVEVVRAEVTVVVEMAVEPVVELAAVWWAATTVEEVARAGVARVVAVRVAEVREVVTRVEAARVEVVKVVGVTAGVKEEAATVEAVLAE